MKIEIESIVLSSIRDYSELKPEYCSIEINGQTSTVKIETLIKALEAMRER